MILDRLEHPIVQAPMAGGPSTPALAIAVSSAGGLGFLAAGYRSAEQMRDDIRELREGTSAPFGVNLFVPGDAAVDDSSLRAYVDELRAEASRYGAEVAEPRADDDDWEAKLAVLREDPVPVVSFTFGCPAADVLRSLDEIGSETWVTVTSPAEARTARDAGANALVLQGVEAGGHRATFDDHAESEGLSALALLRLVASEIDLPLVATGGIADGPAVAAVLAGGAAAAQVGSAFMLAPEAATNPAHRAALAEDSPTALTRAFSGRLARGVLNRFMVEHDASAPRAYPHVHHATSAIRAAARQANDPGGFNLWAGQAHRLARELPAAELVRILSEDARAALEAAANRLP
jgi:nitronate monooxygenase